MNFVFLDLEWNNAYSKEHKRFINEIIEIGAVKLDEDFNEIDRFDSLIKSQITNRLGTRFKNLTNISNDEMSEGVPFADAVKKFSDWCGSDFLTITWSNSDLYAIVENFNSFLSIQPDNYFENYLDLQRYYQSVIPAEDKNQISLKKAAEDIGISLDEVALHRASDDSAITAEIFKKIADMGDYTQFITDTRTADFYPRLTFKAYLIDDFSNKNIKPEDMQIFCSECNTIMKPLQKWKITNKQFSNVFVCKNCKKKYLGRVRIKQYYDYTRVKKSVLAIKKPQNTAKSAETKQ